MKRIYLDESRWGKGYLLYRSGKKMCCLGFASEQLGAPKERLKGVPMPTNSIFSGGINSPELDIPDSFHSFKEAGERLASDELIEQIRAICGRLDREAIMSNRSLFTLLAVVNDYYHSRKIAHRKQIRSKVLGVLRAGFREMGYQLVVKRSS